MVAAEDEIRIEDLRNPVPTDAHRLALEHAERHPADLTEDAVLATASRETGLDEFGPEDFRERLRSWVRETADDPYRTEFGRTQVFRLFVRSATVRLRLQDMLRRHPEIHEIQIRRPIIVVGPWRSGTTHLHRLLATDSRLRSLPLWEAMEPIPAPDETARPDEVNPRFARCVEAVRQRQALLPHLAACHTLDARYAEEDGPLLAADFVSYAWPGNAPARGWLDYYPGPDQTPHYRYMRTLLKALQWQRGPDRWVLKYPYHANHIVPLLKTFPDAVIVMTHRDPAAVVRSIAISLAYIARLDYRQIDTDLLVAGCTESLENMLRAILRDRHIIPKDDIVDVFFNDFMVDQVGTVERVYATAGMEFTKAQRARVKAYLAENPRDKHGRISNSLEADFGVDSDKLRAHFNFYFPAR